MSLIRKTYPLLAATLASAILFACDNDKNMTRLAGEWNLSQQEVQGGMPLTTDVTLDLHPDKTGTMTLTISTEGMPHFVTLSAPLTWSATSETLLVDTDDEKTTVQLSDELEVHDASERKEMESELREMFMREAAALSAQQIESITPDSVVLSQGGRPCVLHKK